MKTVLYASLTANGYVAQADADGSISPEVLGDFVGHVQQAGNVIIGRRTFDLMSAAGAAGALGGADLVVLSTTGNPPGTNLADRPEEALRILDARGYSTAVIGGGAVTYESFLRAGLVDELYLNVLPVLTGGGRRLSLADAQLADVDLIGTTTIGATTVQLRYALAQP